MLYPRWHTYRIDLGDFTNGQAKGISFKLDSDSWFLLRGLGAYRRSNSFLSRGSIEFTVEPDVWTQREFANADGTIARALTLTGAASQSLTGIIPNSAQNGKYVPVWPGSAFWPDSLFQCMVANSSGGSWTAAVLLLRGIKLVEELQLSPYDQPVRDSIPYTHAIDLSLADVERGREIPISLDVDEDFVVRSLTALEDTSSPAGAWQRLYYELTDTTGKAFMNSPIHTDWLFSRNEAERPATIVPEIYIPRRRQLLLRVTRDESGLGTLRLQLNLQGALLFR